jgi:signal transduction histidine kinase
MDHPTENAGLDEGSDLPLSFFVIEDSEPDAVLLERRLRKEWSDANFEFAHNGAEFEERCLGKDFDIIICDFNLPGLDAWSALRRAKEVWPDSPFLVLSGAVGEETAVDLIKGGASDVILKSQPGRVVPSIRRALNERDAKIREREAQKRAEEAIRGREDMLAVVSHDLRNPLSTILLLSQIHVDRLDKSIAQNAPLPPERVRETIVALSKIRRAAGFMRTLIEDVLLLEDAARSELVIAPTETRLDGFLSELKAMFEPIAKEKDVILETELKAGLQTALFDPDRLFQALSNLISNAMKFSPRGGRILVRIDATPAMLTLDVMDSGDGVPSSLRDKIFEKFFKVDMKDRSGIGLGLYIAKTIVQNHGGTIRFFDGVSPDPTGACFRIQLPQSLWTGAVGAPGDGAKRVLFVDDDEDLREVIASELRRRGFVVEEVETLSAAKDWIARSPAPVDVLLVDYRLPDGKGTELVSFLQTQKTWKDVPFLLLSGEMNIGALAQVSGITSFVPKPPNLRELVKRLGQITQG